MSEALKVLIFSLLMEVGVADAVLILNSITFIKEHPRSFKNKNPTFYYSTPLIHDQDQYLDFLLSIYQKSP